MSRRFQFSLRALLAFIIICCIALGCWRLLKVGEYLEVRRAKKRGQALESLLAAGVSVAYRVDQKTTWLHSSGTDHFHLDLNEVPVTIALENGPPTPAIAVHLANINGLFLLNLSDCCAEDLACLTKISDGCLIKVCLTVEEQKRLRARFPRCTISRGLRRPRI